MAAEESKSKQQKPNEDRLSSLPDPLLMRILSLLPSKTSVQTTILSSRWHNMWRRLSVLNFSDDDFININPERFKRKLKNNIAGRPYHKFVINHSERFNRFKRVFLFMNGFTCLHESYKIQKMRLSLTKSITDHRLCTTSVNNWIKSVIGPLIKELNLTLYTEDDATFFQIPNNFSECTNLVSLSLEGALRFDLLQADSFCLRSLKKLRLNIRGMDVTSLNILLNGCSCLEFLDLYFYAEDYTRIFTPSLCVPHSLNMLKITVYVYNSDHLQTEVLYLKNLSISDADSDGGILQNVREASLDVSNASAFTLINLLQALSGIKHLAFSPSATKLLLGCDADLHFPNFGHLLHPEKSENKQILNMLAEEPTSKQQKPNEDRISSLPDPLLIKILSSISSKTSVQTTILSSRWRHLWKHVSVLNLSDDNFIKFNSERFRHFRKFSYFVNNLIYVLKLCKVKKIRLSCTQSFTDNPMCTASIFTWIHSAIGPIIKELDITLYTIHNYCFSLPKSISECTNLVSLSLKGALGFDLQLAKSIRLPSLKNLRLDIGAMDVASLNAFLRGCPCLETLDLYLNVEDYRICVPLLCLPSSLKRLKISVNNFSFRTFNKTEVLLLDNLSISEAGKLQNAFLYASNASALTLCKLLHAVSGIKHLGLNPSSTERLLGDVTHVHFPNFGHLLHLNLNLLWFNVNSLMSLLQKCHSLEVLIIQNDKEVCNDKEEQSSLPKWTAQPSVPSCLESHLSFIQFKGYRGFIDELFFAEYILQKGCVLKTMIIVDVSENLKEKFDNLKRLSNVPKASRMCQLTFS